MEFIHCYTIASHKGCMTVQYSYYVIIPATVISMSAHIDVVSRTEGTFRVQCTSRGGGTVNMSVTGSDGYNSSLTAIEDSGENSVLRRSLVGTTNIISNRSDGDTYNCTASNTVSTVMDSVKLRGIYN